MLARICATPARAAASSASRSLVPSRAALRSCGAALTASCRRPLSSETSGTSSLPPEELERRFLVGNYSADGVRVRPGLVFESGAGSKLYGNDGREYIDWTAGIAVNALGHSDPEVAAVLAAQALKIGHTSNLFHTREPLELARMLVESSAHFDKVFLCNSGTEANEAALKFARKVSLARAQELKAAKRAAAGDDAPPPPFAPRCKQTPPTKCLTQGGVCSCWPQVADNDLALAHKTEFVAFKGSFHGRSMGSLAVTHKPQIRAPFGPFPGDVKFGRFNSIEGEHRRAEGREAGCLRLDEGAPPPMPPMPPLSPHRAAPLPLQTPRPPSGPRRPPSSLSRRRARAASFRQIRPL